MLDQDAMAIWRIGVDGWIQHAILDYTPRTSTAGGCLDFSDGRFAQLELACLCSFRKERVEIWPRGVDGWIQRTILDCRPQIGVV
jgi:hypothetical protein